MGVYSVPVVGESQYQAAVGQLRLGDRLRLRPEPTNPYDPRAVKVMSVTGATIGYLPRDSWLTRCLLDDGTAVSAKVLEVAGGGPGKPALGVVMEVRTGAHAEE